MTTIAVSGATGNLGGLVIDQLLEAGLSPSRAVPLVRSAAKGEAFAERGMSPRVASYNDQEGFASALKGVDRLVFIPSPVLESAKRVDLHHGVVMAARRAGLEQIAWVSLADPEERPFGMEDADVATEYTIRAAGIPFTILRNSVYLDELGPELAVAADTGELLSITQGQSLNWAPRADQAAAIAGAVTQEGHLGATYNLVSPEPYTYDDLATLLTDARGRVVRHHHAPVQDVIDGLVAGGMNRAHSESMVNDFQAAIVAEKFHTVGRDIEKLSGRSGRPTPEYLDTLVNRGLSVNWAS